MDLIQQMRSYVEAYEEAESRLTLLADKTEGISDELVAATIYVEVEQTIEDVPVVFGLLNGPTNLCRQALKSRADAIKRKLRFSEEARKQVDLDYRRRKEAEDSRLARLAAERKSEEQKSKLTTKAVVNQKSGDLEGYNVFDEEGKFLRFAPVKRVPITK